MFLCWCRPFPHMQSVAILAQVLRNVAQALAFSNRRSRYRARFGTCCVPEVRWPLVVGLRWLRKPWGLIGFNVRRLQASAFLCSSLVCALSLRFGVVSLNCALVVHTCVAAAFAQRFVVRLASSWWLVGSAAELQSCLARAHVASALVRPLQFASAGWFSCRLIAGSIGRFAGRFRLVTSAWRKVSRQCVH